MELDAEKVLWWFVESIPCDYELRKKEAEKTALKIAEAMNFVSYTAENSTTALGDLLSEIFDSIIVDEGFCDADGDVFIKITGRYFAINGETFEVAEIDEETYKDLAKIYLGE